MGLRKAAGILVLSVQAVIGADYYIQTRDAGMHWGELSATDYGTIVQHRYARAKARKEAGLTGRPNLSAREGQTAWNNAASFSSSLLGGGEQIAGVQGGTDEPAQVCVRRGNVADC